MEVSEGTSRLRNTNLIIMYYYLKYSLYNCVFILPFLIAAAGFITGGFVLLGILYYLFCIIIYLGISKKKFGPYNLLYLLCIIPYLFDGAPDPQIFLLVIVGLLINRKTTSHLFELGVFEGKKTFVNFNEANLINSPLYIKKIKGNILEKFKDDIELILEPKNRNEI